LLYRRQNYNCLGVARAARYFAAEAKGIGEIPNQHGTAEFTQYCNAVPRRVAVFYRAESPPNKDLKMKGKHLDCQLKICCRPKDQLSQTRR